jgi:hypothetical protein
MKLVNTTNIIKKYKCEIKVSEIVKEHLIICKVTCTGISKKNRWEHLYPSTYGGYAMLLEKHLIDLTGKNFLAYQINEHSRGGHYEYEMQLMDLQGNVLKKFSSNYNSKILFDDNYTYFLQSGTKPFNRDSDPDLNFIKLNHKTGEIKHTVQLNYSALLKCPYKYIIAVNFTEKHNRFYLLIKYSDIENDIRSKRIDLL